ncbi:Asp23/Gls24 family envelope stress response protein [Actinophytocola oryzae]|uniref:Putative alkaline shock family protein YloU n=1 Tax=Actinophytocola oryzae TaxID=502181 RepID=A0A4R7VHV3_9PSEU|nr:Asp23/Gls24 family envelope stress response protein [Actinophytocola oryzae]TDV48745.1 putative alkaline shock family protein YloU [Actinophytocola oryzae]
MTAATAPVREHTDDPDVDLPGRTTLADRAVEHTAVQAITEVADVGGAAGRLLGAAEDRSAQVSVTVDGTTAALDVRLSIAYPASVARRTQEVRDHLVERVHELTGLVVTRVDITVTALYLAQPAQGRVR